jgi:hypothetical protein
MPEPEAHVNAMIAALPQHEMRPLMAGMLQRLLTLDGPSLVTAMFPEIGKVCIDPYRDNSWKPK